MTTASPSALQGIRVLELANFFAGPFCGSLLGDFGAEVIKAEQPGAGDPWRHQAPKADGIGLHFLSDNRNKRLVSLNLAKREGQELARRFAAISDVVVENFREGTLEGWGLGYDDLRKLNPAVILVRISGFGQTGPYKQKLGFGTILEAMTTFQHTNGSPDGTPRAFAFGLGDLLTGTMTAYAIMAALRHRDLTGEGQVIDASLADCLIRWIGDQAADYQLHGRIKGGTEGAWRPTSPTTGLFRAGDGGWLFIRCHHSDEVVTRLWRAIGRPEWCKDREYAAEEGRIRNASHIRKVLEEWVAARSRVEALAALESHRVACGPVYNIAELLADPHFQERQVFVEAPQPTVGMLKTPAPAPRLSRSPGRVQFLPGVVGQDNAEVYRTLLGLTPDDLAALQRQGVI